MLRADFSFSCPYDLDNLVFNPPLGSGALLDVGIYSVMMALEIFGPSAKISAQSIPSRDSVDASTSILIQHDTKQLSILSCSIQQDGNRTVEILGQNGRLEIGPQWWKPSSAYHLQGNHRNDLTPEAQGLGYHYEARHLQEMLTLGNIYSDRWSPEKSLRLMQTLDKIRALIGLSYGH